MADPFAGMGVLMFAETSKIKSQMQIYSAVLLPRLRRPRNQLG
jgi:hypothetical protein